MALITLVSLPVFPLPAVLSPTAQFEHNLAADVVTFGVAL
jgi:hypothetical protein